MSGSFVFFVLTMLLAPVSHAHKGEKHESHHELKKEAPSIQMEPIVSAYKTSVNPIFQRSCFNCHSQSVQYPWYYRIPGAKQLIDKDISEAREHLDMSRGFPFGGHGSLTEDLEAIRDAIQNDSMPPFRYRLMHWGASLSSEEKAVVLNWVGRSLEALKHGP